MLVELEGPAEVLAAFEASIVLIFGLAHEGKVNAAGVPSLLQLAVVAVAFREVIVFTTPPRIVQRTVLPLVALLGRAVGRRAAYPQHRSLVVRRA